jgi:uncharacterized protein (DUF885 family)
MSLTHRYVVFIVFQLMSLSINLTPVDAQMASPSEIADQFEHSHFFAQPVGEGPLTFHIDSINTIENRIHFLSTVYRSLAEQAEAAELSELALDMKEFARQELLIQNSCQPGVWSYEDFYSIYDYFANVIRRLQGSDDVIEDTDYIDQSLSNLAQILESAISRLEASLATEIYPSHNSIIFWTTDIDHWRISEADFQHYLDLYQSDLCTNCPNNYAQLYQEQYSEMIQPLINRFSQLIDELRPWSHNLVYQTPPSVVEPCTLTIMETAGINSRTPKQILNLGMRELERVERKMFKIVSAQMGLSKSLKEEEKLSAINQFLDQLNEDPSQYYESSEEYLDYARQLIDRGMSLLPLISDHMVEPPHIIDLQMETDNFPGALYRSFDDTLILNSPTPTPRYGMAELIAHEGPPGHHLERSIAKRTKGASNYEQISPGHHSLIEGWAFYMEEYVDQLDYYQNDLERLNYLDEIRIRALRLILPYRIFLEDWTMEQARTFAMAHSRMPEFRLNSELQRNSHWRGQVLHYMIGKEDIQHMKDQARQALGEEYSDKDFHTFFLLHGNKQPRALYQLFLEWLDRSRE